MSALEARLGEVLKLRAQLRSYDGLTARHSDRVAEYAQYLGATCHLDRTTLLDLRVAATMHDIGKLGIPLEILQKPGDLTDEEEAIMASHAEIGYDILRRRFGEDIAAVARDHHKYHKVPGNYSDLTRLVAVPDIWDAARSRRPYKEASNVDEAEAQLKLFCKDDPLALSYIQSLADASRARMFQTAGYLWRNAG